MKTVMIKDFTSLPASFVAVSPNSESPLYTRAKLKVFYEGETVDHRLFTSLFSEKLLKTAGYTPVVSKFNLEKNDFEGHSSQQQIYGIVDPVIEPLLEKIGNETWAILEVILYTERPDDTGTIAKKIIGQPQSLELKHDTVQYKINRDEKTGKFKNIEFTEGQFIGVSVLGKDQEPAFAGSAFFNVVEFNEQLSKIKEYCDNTRGETMNVTIPTFVEQSWGEKQRYVSEALAKKYGEENIWLNDMYEEFCIFYLWDSESKKAKLMKSTYVCNVVEGGCEVTLGEPVPVRVVYEEMSSTEPKPVTTELKTDGEPTTDKTSTIDVASATTEGQTTVTTDPATAAPVTTENTPTAVTTEDNLSKIDPVITPTPNSVVAEAKAENNETTTTNTTSLTDSEQKELAEYRRKDKLALIQSYSEQISNEDLENYTKNVEQYTHEALENALNSAFVRYFKTIKPTKTIGFSWAPEEKSPSLNTVDDKIAAEMREKKNRGIK